MYSFRITLILCLLLFVTSGAMAEDCLQAREWYEEGLSLSDNSKSEIYYYQRAIHFCPDFVAAHNRLGEVYKNRGEYRQAIQAFEMARIHATSSTGFASRSDSKELFLESAISLGEIYKIQGKYELAADEYSKALSMDPESTTAQNSIQYLYKRMHRYDDVLSSNNQLLVNALFTRISGLTLPRKTYTIDFQVKNWSQTSPPITEDLIDMDNLIYMDETHHTSTVDFGGDGFKFLVTPSELASRTNSVILALRYGLTNNITLGLVPKVFWRKYCVHLEGFDDLVIPDSFEPGDTELLLKYHLWGVRKKHVSIYTLLNIPTGKEVLVTGKEPLITRYVTEDADGNLEYHTYEFDFARHVPFGSENWDITPGIAASIGLNPLVLHANMSYKFTDGLIMGDEFRVNLASVYNINDSVNGTLELNYRWQGEAKRTFHSILYKFQPDDIGRGDIPVGPIAVESTYTVNSGHTLFLSPGMQFTVGDRLRFELGAQIPIIKKDAGWSENIIYQIGMTVMSF